MASETEILRLALLAYEAAAQPQLWPGFLKSYTEAISGDSAVLQIHDLNGNRSGILAEFGISSPMKQSYNEHYSALNVWRNRGRALYVPGAVNLDAEQCPRPVLERSEFYHDYLQYIGGTYSMGAVIARHRGHVPTLTALRGRSKGEFGEDERKTAKFLLPHLGRAWSICQRLDLLAAGESVMDTLPLGVVFLAADGAAIYCNRAAEEIFRSNDGLFLQQGVLSAIDASANARLGRAVDSALTPGAATASHAAVLVPRTAPCREYQVVATPLRARFRQFAGMPMPLALVLITDPERKKPACSELLVQIYKLTAKEAVLAAKLAEGTPLKQAAAELSMSYETARTHLRRIFSKTGTSRQAALLLLIEQLPAAAMSRNG